MWRSGVFTAVIVALAVAGGARADSAGSCVTGPFDTVDARIQQDGVTVAPSIETALGTQDGQAWFCPTEHQFVIAVAPGPEDLASETSAINAIMAQKLGPDEAAWLEAHTSVRSVAYSRAQLKQVTDTIDAQIPLEATPSAWTVGWSLVDPCPCVYITLNDLRTSADISAAQQIVAQDASLVTLELISGGPPVLSLPPLNPRTRLRITRIRYLPRSRRLLVTIAPGSAALHAVIVTVASRTSRRLGGATLAHLRTTITVSIQLRRRAPTNTIVGVRARDPTGLAEAASRAV